jgi:uncharacterized protein (DUF2225 family)
MNSLFIKEKHECPKCSCIMEEQELFSKGSWDTVWYCYSCEKRYDELGNAIVERYATIFTACA